MPVPSAYQGREQTYVKHTLLRNYLERFGYKIGSSWARIDYVDCFAGPWGSTRDDLGDTSFGIAYEALTKAQQGLRKVGRMVDIRFCFIESDRTSFKKLKAYVDQHQRDGVKMLPLHGEFEEKLNDVRSFLEEKGDKAFRFLLIDPKGWTGFALRKIAPLVECRSAEILVNVMTSHIRRFVTKEAHATQFEELFGDKDVVAEAAGLSGSERERLLVRRYAEKLKTAAGLSFISTAAILKAEQDAVHYYLVFGTNSAHGIQVFKEAEQAAFSLGEEAREQAKARKRERRTGQTELAMFSEAATEPSSIARELRAHYLAEAYATLTKLLRPGQSLPYDELLGRVLQTPLVWKTDLDERLYALLAQNAIQITPSFGGKKLRLSQSYQIIVR